MARALTAYADAPLPRGWAAMRHASGELCWVHLPTKVCSATWPYTAAYEQELKSHAPPAPYTAHPTSSANSSTYCSPSVPRVQLSPRRGRYWNTTSLGLSARASRGLGPFVPAARFVARGQAAERRQAGGKRAGGGGSRARERGARQHSRVP